jgi:hypothetical protein
LDAKNQDIKIPLPNQQTNLYYLPIPVVKPCLSAGMGTYNVDGVGFAKDGSIGYN